jgi:hypothetical protein
MVPFLAMPLALAVRRYPGPTIALAGVSITTMVVATITHPLVVYETEPVKWARYLRQGFFQPTLATAYGAGRGWGAVLPTLALFAGAAVLATLASARVHLSLPALAAGALAIVAWALFAVLAPPNLGLDHQGLLDILHAGDRTALHKGFGSHPLDALALIASLAGVLGLGLARLLRHRDELGPPDRLDPPRRRTRASEPRAQNRPHALAAE